MPKNIVQVDANTIETAIVEVLNQRTDDVTAVLLHVLVCGKLAAQRSRSGVLPTIWAVTRAAERLVGEHKIEKERYPRRYRGLSERAVPPKEAPKGIGLARFAPTKGWDTSKGRKWVVVAFWGVETTVTFCRDDDEANMVYEDALLKGADVFYAKTVRMMRQSDPPVA